MLKVTFLIPDLCTGGVEINFLRLINYFPEHEITSSIAYQNEIDNGDYRSKNKPSVKFDKLNSGNSWTLFLELRKYFKTKKPDILILSMYGVAIIAILARLFSSSNPKIIINGSNHFSSIIEHNKNFAERIFLKYGAKLTFRFADFFVSQCNDMTADLVKVLGLQISNISTINNPIIDENFFEILGSKVDHKWLIDENRDYKVIIMAGRLVPQKGILEFLDIFKNISNKIDIKLIIMGEGKLKGPIVRKVSSIGLEEIVDILPNQSNYRAFIAASDLLVVNSFHEGLNNMLVESLACGTPVVSTDCPVGPREVLSFGKYGRLSPLHEPEIMQNEILSELTHSKFSTSLMKNRAMEFTVKDAADKYIELFKNLTN